MNRLFGYLVGVLWLGLAFGAFQRGRAGGAEGFSDMVVWWTIIAAFLAIAGLGALIGTTLHTAKNS
ncbi:MAG: hypothetical protein RQ745_08710 [Longimicrobiales bacterium]|nr:hypothetical protein [Longimicrobiales bacterium]